MACFPKLFAYSVPPFLLFYTIWSTLYNYLFYFNQFCVVSFLLIFAWSTGYYLFEHFNKETVSGRGKIVLVTGCDTGFGHNLARKLDRFGFDVFAGVLFPDGEGAKKLRDVCSERLHIVKMDVTKADDVQNVVQQIKDTKMPLWGVVNNAGIGISCPFDWGRDIEPLEKTFGVNVYGVFRVAKFCMPLLRKSRGRLVNVASLAGRITTPMISHYSMSKHSVRVLSDTIRRENTNSGVKVVTIEPTFYKTPIIDFEQIRRTRQRIYEDTPDDIKEAYDDKKIEQINNTENMVDFVTRHNLDEVVDTMLKAVTLKQPKLFYRCCSYLDVVLVWGVSHLPETILDFACRYLFSNRKSYEFVKSYISMKNKVF